MCIRIFRFWTWIVQLSTKYQFFHEIAQNFAYSRKSQFLMYNYNFLDQLLLSYEF